jgi:hypothetical protein
MKRTTDFADFTDKFSAKTFYRRERRVRRVKNVQNLHQFGAYFAKSAKNLSVLCGGIAFCSRD